MSDVKYKQLHQFSCGSLMNINRRSLVTSCPHGCIICACNDGLLLYDTKQYFTATQVCKLRRDKPLPSHKPNITISSIDPICWIAFNSDGLTLAVVTSSENRGTLVNLVNVFNVVQHGSTDLSNISRSVRVCGGEVTGWRLRDFSWSPTDPATFVVILESGAVRLFNFSTDGNGSVTLVDQLPVTADCRCVSWSPKGKQLAICLNGSLSTADGIIQGPLILQVDPQMHQKRLVPLTHLFNSNSRWKDSSPVDLLWTSSYSFLIAVKQYTDENHSFCSTQVLYISTTSKSPEPSAVTVESLCSSRVECDKAQYYFRFLGTNYVAVTWAYVGEEVIILQLPNTSGSLPPQVVMSIELPADGLAVSMDIGVFQEDDERKENYLVYLLTCLSNGSICPYLLNSDNPKILLNPSLPKILSLPIPKSTITSVEKQLIDTAKPESTNNSFSFTPIVNQVKPVVSSPVNFNTSVSTTTCSMYNVPSTPFTAFKAFDEKKTISFQDTANTNISLNRAESLQTMIEQEVKENLNVKCEAPNRSRDIPLPKSVEAAAAHFTSSLKSEANAGRLAWQNLLNVLSNGDIDGKSSESIGVDVIEARLCDVDRFLKAMDEVITELTTALNERKEDLSNSVIFGERLRRALRLYASGDWFSAISSHLDPETNRLFSQLKRRARLAEAGLFDLEDQIQRLSSELDSLQSKSSTTPNSRGKEKYSTRNGVGNNSPIIRALDTNANLIRAERGRIDYIVENLKRLGLSPMKCESKNDLKNAKQQTVRTSLNRSNVSFSKEDNVNPLRNMINERDQALFRLFSNYKLPIIHPSKVCPSISTEVESSKFTDSKGGDSFSDMQPSSDVHRNATTLSPSIKNSRLEQLLVVSGELASNTVVSTSPKTPLSTITKAETEAKKSTAVPLTPTTPLSKTPTSSLLSKPSLSMGLTKNQNISYPSTTSTSFINTSPVTNVKACDANTSTQQFLSTTTKPFIQSLSTLTTTSSAMTVSTPTNRILFAVTATSKPGPFTNINTFGTMAASSTLNSVNSTGSQNSLSQKTEPNSLINLTTSGHNSGTIVSTNSLFNSTVDANLITTTPTSQSVDKKSQEQNEIEITDPSPVNWSTNSSQPTVSSNPGLFSFLPTPVCSTGIIFGSGQQQNTCTSITSTTTSVSNDQTKSSTATTTQSLFGSPSFVSASTSSSTSVTSASMFLFGTASQPTNFSLVNTSGSAVSTTYTTETLVSNTGSLFGITSTATVSTPSLFGTTVFGKGGATTVSSGLFGSNASSLQTLALSTTLPATGVFSFSNATDISMVSTSSVTSASTSVTQSLTSLFSSPGFGKSPEQSKPLFQTSLGSTATTSVTTTNTSTVSSSGLFGSLTNTSGGGSKLFSSLPTTQSGGFLFGSASNQVSGSKLFHTNVTSPVVVSSASATFGSLFASPSITSSTNTNTPVSAISSLFHGGDSTQTKSPGLFQFSSGTSLFNTPTTNSVNSTPSTGLFGTTNPQQATTNSPGSGLFGSVMGTDANAANSLFSVNSLNLGGNQAPSNPVQNIFGKAFGNQANSASTLFGSPSSVSQSNTNVSNPPLVSQSSPFSNSVFGSSLFNSPASSTATSGGSDGLFSSLGSNVNSGTGLFGSQTSPTNVGGFGSPPIFGSPSFGGIGSVNPSGQGLFGMSGTAAFNSGAGLFGSAAPTGGSLFGTNTNPPAGGGLFAALGNKPDNLTFGSLAQASPPGGNMPASPFSTSPSFTQRRA